MNRILNRAEMLIILLGLFSFESVGKTVGVFYFKHFFGNIHQNASRYSTTLTTVACGDPIKVYQRKMNDLTWRYVLVGPHKGYVLTEFLSETRPRCFQKTYPRFFDRMEISLTELYYWGRLYDQYILGKSKVR